MLCKVSALDVIMIKVLSAEKRYDIAIPARMIVAEVEFLNLDTAIITPAGMSPKMNAFSIDPASPPLP